ncbi:MAG: hypothetical protein M3Q52_08570, partial [Pseudomonadota bacterium]|nr:hypothetical protein [Pseudomonadota bacterium]
MTDDGRTRYPRSALNRPPETAQAPQIRAFHLNALASQVPLAVDLDTTLSVLCDSIYRKFALRLDNG